MTTLMTRPGDRDGLWSSMPGWGIVADLTPPELTESRRLKVLRKLIALCLGVVIVLCAAGFGLAYTKSSAASDSLDAANARTTSLTREQHKFNNVTQIQAATKSIDTQIATLMTSDVDAAALLSTVRAALPGSMSLTSVNVTLAAGPGGSPAATTPSLDTSGLPTIGTLTLNGSAQTLTDLATYVRKLVTLRGLVNVVPSSNTAGTTGAGAQWTVTMQLTDQLYTHRYDATATGGK